MPAYIGTRISRDDAVCKATGQLKFFGDLQPENCLHGAVYRAAHPHAKILEIHTKDALAVPGVVDVLTWRDIPGENYFGIGAPDQPVLCRDKTRFIGDPIAVVIAETEAVARAAVQQISISYVPLPLVTDVKAARLTGSITVQADTNIASSFSWKTGNPDAAFAEAAVVVEKDYQTQYQEHAYLETEVAIASPTPDGGIEIWAPAQYPYRDIAQLSKILALSPAQIHCHAHPIGGGFGGKDDMALQPLAAVAAWKLGKSVRLYLNREESFLYSTKRVPFTFHMKTAADREGHLLAHQVEAYGDVGPYTGISVAVFNYGVENACGAYYFPNISIHGEAIFTNNAHTGSFRGFGNNQLNWGLETQLDLIAEQLQMDRLTLREKNLIRTGHRLSYGHLHGGCPGLQDSFCAARQSWLWQHQEEFKAAVSHPWCRRGIGIASGQHGNGLGNALKDEGMVRLELKPNGVFSISIAMADMGQGLLTTCHMIAAEQLQVRLEQVEIILGETDLAPDTGPTTASRSTYVAGNAICDAVKRFQNRILEFFRQCGHRVELAKDGLLYDGVVLSWQAVYPRLQQQLCQAIGKFVVPITDLQIQIGLHCIHTHVTQVTGVEVDTLTGKITVLATEILPAAGTVINRIGYEGQCEGGIVMAMGYAVLEDYQFGPDGRPKTKNFQTYLVPTIQDIPEKIWITPMEAPEPTGPFGSKGLGEPVTIPGAPAITNAIHDACGILIQKLPANPEYVLHLLQKKETAN